MNTQSRRTMLTVLAVVGLLSSGCGVGSTLVMSPPTVKRAMASVTVVADAPAVTVPEDMQTTFQSKLTTALYITENFQQGPALTLRYRFVQFDPGSQVARYFMGPLGGSGKLMIEVRYLDDTNQEIARIQSTGSVSAGVGGGPMADALDRAVDEILLFTKQHFQ
jgi:hypothetical protein